MKKILSFLSITLFLSSNISFNTISCQKQKQIKATINSHDFNQFFTSKNLFSQYTTMKFNDIIVNAQLQLAYIYNHDSKIKKAIKNNAAQKIDYKAFNKEDIIKLAAPSKSDILTKKQLEMNFSEYFKNASSNNVYLILTIKDDNQYFNAISSVSNSFSKKITINLS